MVRRRLLLRAGGEFLFCQESTSRILGCPMSFVYPENGWVAGENTGNDLVGARASAV
jgi:hypothetical protein